ncbi:LysE family translocator [Piscicoccus intestinalis]|uniref:LysE family translocator n=1 Tax=Piscicoccus intestinalis TaxID=746033 RepID=UPI00083924FC
MTPGLDTAVVLRSALASGSHAGIRTALGCATGLFAHAAGVALGLSAILLNSAAVFEAVRLSGAVLLVAFGLISLWSACRNHQPLSTEPGSRRRRGPYVQGLLTNLMNPKATLFFLAALPQFVASGGQPTLTALFLALIAGGFSAGGLSLVAVLAGRARRLLSSARARRIQEATMGTVLVGLGLRVATEAH